jgi:predicted transcriptional regulator
MDVLAVIGSKARLDILRHLSKRDMYVSELMDAVGMDGKTATHHIDVLLEAELIDAYTSGQRRYLRLVRDVNLEISPSPNRRFVARFPETTTSESES